MVSEAIKTSHLYHVTLSDILGIGVKHRGRTFVKDPPDN